MGRTIKIEEQLNSLERLKLRSGLLPDNLIGYRIKLALESFYVWRKDILINEKDKT